MKKRICLVAVILTLGLVSCRKENSVDLSGVWQVSLDSLASFQPMQLPGTTDLAGLGEPNMLEPAISGEQIQRLTRKHSFIGAAFYKREFNVPRGMEGKPLELTLERVLWQSSVWIDGERLEGAEESLTTPHRYLIPEGLAAGTHEIMLRIDNRKRYDISWRDLAHSYTNDTQTIWNGVLGDMTLRALPSVEIAHVDIYPDAGSLSAKVLASIVRHDPEISEVLLRHTLDGGASGKTELVMAGDTAVAELTLKFDSADALWDEFSPVLHTLDLAAGDDRSSVRFGLRSIGAEDGRITVNGRKVFMRGALDCCIFPLTGFPPTDEEGWRKEFEVCREWGYNHIRFHSWCPPEAAFNVADEMGFYLQVELPAWSKAVGQEDVDNFLRSEYDRIVRSYGNHPSFCMLSCGNEFDSGYEFLNGLLSYMKASDPRRIYTNSTYSMGAGHKGRPEPEDQYMIASRTVRGQIRGQDYLGSRAPDFRSDYSEYAAGVGIPLISHEIGQYSVYPDLRGIDKYTGTLDPLNLKGIRAELTEKGLIDRAEDWTLASGRLAAILYKEEVERALKTPELAGFQVLGLQDFSGQATAHVGLVDAFWDGKGLVDPSWFRQANAPVVPLVRYEKPCWTSDETFTAGVEVANYWSDDISGMLDWRLLKGDEVLASGEMAAQLPTGQTSPVRDSISVDLSSVGDCPSRLTLELAVRDTEWKNSWSIWVYPAEESADFGEVVLAETVDAALDELSEGGTVLLAPDPSTLKGEPGKFVPVFWSPVFFPDEAGTMGVLCNPEDPALALFPTDMHSDWQWWNLAVHSKALVLDGLSADIRPIVEAVDNFVMNRRLAYIFEAECESGRLLVCSMDISSDEARLRPEVRALLASLLDYMNSPAFNPSGRLKAGELKSFLN